MAVTWITATGIAVASCVLLYTYILYPILVSPLAKIPNAHFTAPISPAWIIWKRYREQNNRTIHAAHMRLGPIVRLGPSEISINCVEGGIKTVYGGGFEKHEWYPRVFASLDTVSMFTMTGSKEHAIRKRMLSNIYSKSFLQSSPNLKLISKTMIYDRLLPILEEAASSKKPIDVHDLNSALTMDFVSAYLYGLCNASNLLQDISVRKHILHNYQCRKPFEFYYQEVPSLIPISRAIGIPVIPKWCQDAGSVMDEWNLDLCDKADKCITSTDPESEPTVYKQLKNSMRKQSSFRKDDPEGNAQALEQQKLDIACETYDQLTAGHETSATGLTYLYWELSKHPEIQTDLRKELHTLTPPISSPPSSKSELLLPSPKDIDALPLLQAIIMETLRLHAPIPGIQPRITPSPSTSLGGYDNIPPNVRVNAQAYSLHRNPEVFPDPESWQPRRWLKDDHSREMEEMRRWFWAFGSGGRMCVGSNLAVQEMKLATAAIYSNFTSIIVDDTGIEAIDAYTVRPSSNKLILKFEHI
ncbi:putative cytochrome P450 monooxygenase [Talaromyces proteolyticus]|uniref:Cytochrome P450 monooxygenase n=1 Tax=Talaromyces proteolyticus TaxID=1131652 RepID=A0AAD4Q2K2_9EURO|nr:putative cytochrome P450 monooxygenase [Talaromyces proteolyticus]KAH8700507.1 putative cytochrome P450 monooxygenase [Talaromyces proteolyticus]